MHLIEGNVIVVPLDNVNQHPPFALGTKHVDIEYSKDTQYIEDTNYIFKTTDLQQVADILSGNYYPRRIRYN